MIAARFDGDVHGETCRLAFYGRILSLIDPAKPQDLQQLKVYKVFVYACCVWVDVGVGAFPYPFGCIKPRFLCTLPYSG